MFSLSSVQFNRILSATKLRYFDAPKSDYNQQRFHCRCTRLYYIGSEIIAGYESP